MQWIECITWSIEGKREDQFACYDREKQKTKTIQTIGRHGRHLAFDLNFFFVAENEIAGWFLGVFGKITQLEIDFHLSINGNGPYLISMTIDG